jgi:hypothetical protein
MHWMHLRTCNLYEFLISLGFTHKTCRWKVQKRALAIPQAELIQRIVPGARIRHARPRTASLPSVIVALTKSDTGNTSHAGHRLAANRG